MKSRFLLSIVACLSVFQACDNCLDETKYTYSISSETFYNTVDEANAAVLAPLDIMRLNFDSNFYTLLEVNTEYCYAKGIYETYNEYNGFMNSTQITRNESNWIKFYKTIMYCNTAIESYRQQRK